MKIEHRVIPDLRRKLRLLRDHHHFASLSEIAAAIGVKLKTLETWADSGSDLQTPGLVPMKKFGDLVGVFVASMPETSANLNIADILRDKNIAALESLFRAKHRSDLLEITSREAQRTNAIIYTADGRLSLVRATNARAPEPDYSLTLGEPFRIELHDIALACPLVGLQKTPTQWGYVPSVQRDGGKIVFLPDFDENGLPEFMIEDGEAGVSRFFLIQAARPLPEEVSAALTLSMLPDQKQLSLLANWYNQTNVTERQFSEVRIEFQSQV